MSFSLSTCVEGTAKWKMLVENHLFWHKWCLDHKDKILIYKFVVSNDQVCFFNTKFGFMKMTQFIYKSTKTQINSWTRKWSPNLDHLNGKCHVYSTVQPFPIDHPPFGLKCIDCEIRFGHKFHCKSYCGGDNWQTVKGILYLLQVHQWHTSNSKIQSIQQL